MRTLRFTTPLRYAAFLAACTLPWIACSDLGGYSSGSEAASDAATSTGAAVTTGAGGAGGTGGSGGEAPAIEARFELPKTGAPAFLDVPFPSDL